MNKNEIISAVSMEFGLSKDQSAKIVDNIFASVSQHLVKSKTLEILKFGKFKVMNDKDNTAQISGIKFTPSKKLALRINNNFENLKKVKLKRDTINSDSINTNSINPDLTDKSPVDEKQDIIFPEDKVEEVVLKEEEVMEPNSPVQRKLLPEDVIKLHQEIISKDKVKEDEDEKDVEKEKDSINDLWR